MTLRDDIMPVPFLLIFQTNLEKMNEVIKGDMKKK
jgi:hypothetical protein